MIIDTLSNAGKYASLHKNFAKAFAFIEAQDLQAIEVGKYPIDGDDLHASVSSRSGVKAADAKFEAHDRHIDIQLFTWLYGNNFITIAVIIRTSIYCNDMSTHV